MPNNMNSELMFLYFAKVKTFFCFVLFILLTLPVTAQIQGKFPSADCQPGDKRIQVLLVASYHMFKPGADKFNPKEDDVFLPKRQAEIQQLVTKLAAFKPDKIAVEALYSDPSVNFNYEQYIKGVFQLQRSEVEQIGFRLAKQLAHPQIFPIDVRMGLDDSKIKQLIARNPRLQEQMKELQTVGNGAINMMAKWLSEGTVTDTLYQMNRPEMLAQAHYPYVLYLAPIAEGNNFAGADMVGDWYKRNFRIFANINKMAEEGNRILVVFGQGNVPILREMIGQSPRFCRVNPLPYLKTQNLKNSKKRK